MRHTVLLCIIGLCISASSTALAQDVSRPTELIRLRWAPPHVLSNLEAKMLARLVYTDISVAFDDISVRDALISVEHAVDFQFAVHYDGAPNEEGLDPLEKITLDVESTPALTVLEMILTQTSSPVATWQLRNGFVEIGRKARLSADVAQEIRYYPVHDFIMDVPCFKNAPGGLEWPPPGESGFEAGDRSSDNGCEADNHDEDSEQTTEREQAQEIINLITEIVEPDAWEANGGDWAKIRYYNGVLIVRAPDFIHRQIFGYPFALTPPKDRPDAERRYLSFGSGLTGIDEVVSSPPG